MATLPVTDILIGCKAQLNMLRAIHHFHKSYRMLFSTLPSLSSVKLRRVLEIRNPSIVKVNRYVPEKHFTNLFIMGPSVELNTVVVVTSRLLGTDINVAPS